MEATIVLLVKGDERTARAAAAHHGLDVSDEPAHVNGDHVRLRARGPEGMLLARAAWWLAEPGEAPYPPGTLLWHSAIGGES